MSDKRKYWRISSEKNAVILSVRTLDAGQDIGGMEFKCRTQDISERGLRLRSGKALPLGAKLQIDVDAGGSQAHLLNGIVRWVNQPPFSSPYYIGIEVTDETGAETLEAWGAFVKSKIEAGAP